jgi:PadR family transcriptional regulator, regulatory protein PadR
MASLGPLGEFEAIVVMAVLHLGETAAGTAVREDIARRTGRAVARGAVYVTLDRLEAKGLLVSRLDKATPERGGHPRRFFKVTALGLKQVRQALTTVERMRAGLEPLLARGDHS